MKTKYNPLLKRLRQDKLIHTDDCALVIVTVQAHRLTPDTLLDWENPGWISIWERQFTFIREDEETAPGIIDRTVKEASEWVDENADEIHGYRVIINHLFVGRYLANKKFPVRKRVATNNNTATV